MDTDLNHGSHQVSASDANAHQKAIRIARWGGQKIFSKPSRHVISAVRRTRKEAVRRHKYNLKKEPANQKAQPIIADILQTSAGSGLDLDAYEATHYLNVELEGMGGGAVNFYLRIVCDYANRWHQRSNPARRYTRIGVSASPFVCPEDMSPLDLDHCMPCWKQSLS